MEEQQAVVIYCKSDFKKKTAEGGVGWKYEEYY